MSLKSLAAVIVTAALAGCGPKAQRQQAPSRLVVFVPCGMELPFMAAQRAFQEANPGTHVEVVLDNANILVKRVLEKGEQPDLIVSPGMVEMEKMLAAQQVRSDDVHHFGRYELVLFGPRTNPGGVKTMEDLRKPEVKTIAIADPEENSVGRYTRQALVKAGLWDALKPKMIFTDHPITAYKHVARCKAEASFAYRSCPLKTAPDKLEYSKVRILQSLPPDSYGPAYASIAVLAATRERELANSFVRFLLSDAGGRLLEQYDVPVLKRLLLFVPCGMMGPFFNVRRLYEEQNPGVSLQLEFDRADALTDRIIKEQATPDVHFSIGRIETDLLVKNGAVAPDAPAPFGTFRLALCAHISRVEILSRVEDLTKPEVKSILLTPPENSSVGYYAKTALEKLGLWEKLQPKVAYLPTIKDCYKEISAGRADASFAYLGCPIPIDPEKSGYSKVKTIQVLDEAAYGGATTFASVLKAARHPKEAEQFIRFLHRPEVRAMLARVGLRPLAQDQQKAEGSKEK